MGHVYRLYSDKSNINDFEERAIFLKLDGLANDLFGGFTRNDVTGGWVNEYLERDVSPGVVYEIAGDDNGDIRQFAQALRQALRQDCILLTIAPVKIELVYADHVKVPHGQDTQD